MACSMAACLLLTRHWTIQRCTYIVTNLLGGVLSYIFGPIQCRATKSVPHFSSEGGSSAPCENVYPVPRSQSNRELSSVYSTAVNGKDSIVHKQVWCQTNFPFKHLRNNVIVHSYVLNLPDLSRRFFHSYQVTMPKNVVGATLLFSTSRNSINISCSPCICVYIFETLFQLAVLYVGDYIYVAFNIC